MSTAEVAAPVRRRPIGWFGMLLRELNVASALALIFVAFLALCMLVPNLIAPHDPTAQDITQRLQPPAWHATGDLSHPLGTDALGRDVFGRLVYASRVTLAIAIGAALLEAAIGVTLGLIAGYKGGRLDRVISGWTDIQISFPAILLLMVIILTVGNSVPALIVAFALNGWMIFARVTRTKVRSLKEQPFVDAAIVAGARSNRILRHHLLPHLKVDIVALGILEMARITLAESGMSFLGIGVQPPAISWGQMLGEGRDYIAVAYHIPTFAGVAISASVVSLTLFARTLAPLLDRSRATPFSRKRILREGGPGGLLQPDDLVPDPMPVPYSSVVAIDVPEPTEDNPG